MSAPCEESVYYLDLKEGEALLAIEVDRGQFQEPEPEIEPLQDGSGR